MASANGVIYQLGMSHGDVYPIAWPFAHIGGIAMLTSVLASGGRLVLFDTWDPIDTPDRMALHRPTVLGSATPFFNGYMAAQRRHGGRPRFPDVRVCVGGGAPIPRAVNDEVAEVLGVRGVVGAWGLTEFPVATSETPESSELGSTVGTAVRGVRIRVVDEELRLKGPQCMLGYVDGSLDAAVFDDEGWFRTGDMGCVDVDGRVRIVGRFKDVIIRNAENVSALQVEEVLLRHRGVADVAVVGAPDNRTGERVVAFVVLAHGEATTLEELTDHCTQVGLARHKRPEELHIVDSLPRNAMGKILKKELRDSLPSS
jgi:acyl-CoA synthetase (AMP-forming)/AMP-acid ligase II